MSSSGAAPDPARPSRDYPGQPAMAARGFSCPRNGDGGLRCAGPSTPGTPWACSAATRQRPAPPATSGARNAIAAPPPSTSRRLPRTRLRAVRTRDRGGATQFHSLLAMMFGAGAKLRIIPVVRGARFRPGIQRHGRFCPGMAAGHGRKGSTCTPTAARRDGPLPARGVKSGAGCATRHRDFPGLAGKQRR